MNKTFIFQLTVVFFLFGSSLNAYAENPSTFCDETTDCTVVMKGIVEQYSVGTSDFTALPESAYSGACYYINPQYDSNTKHYGAFAFEKSSSETLSSGIFGFFYDQDPYARYSGHELIELLKSNPSPFKAIAILENEARLEYLYPGSSISYWFRSSVDKKNLFVLGKDVNSSSINYVFCEMHVR